MNKKIVCTLLSLAFLSSCNFSGSLSYEVSNSLIGNTSTNPISSATSNHESISITVSEPTPSVNDSTSIGENTNHSENKTSISEDSSSHDISTFRIESAVIGGYSYDVTLNRYTITKAGEYNLYGSLIDGQVYVSAEDTDKVILNFNHVKVESHADSPIYLANANKVEISAKSGTKNYIYDLRETLDDSEESLEGSAAIYALCDLELKGKGYLEVQSNVNNGIHTKDDLDIKNLTLKSIAKNNSIKANDSLHILSGNITAISTGGDGLKTTSTDLSKNGVQRGVISIEDGIVDIYSACDGIDASTDVDISSNAKVNIYTDKYSSYSGEVMVKNETTMYIKMSSSIYQKRYQYSAYFYTSNGEGVWKNMEYHGCFQSMGPGAMPPGGPGGGRPGSYYYYYKVEVPSHYQSVKIYAYTSSMTPGQSNDYVAVNSNDTTLPTASDTLTISSISTTNKSISTSGWSTFSSSNGNNGLDYSCKGIKAGNEVHILGGETNIQARDDGIHANFDETLESTSNKGLGNIIISGGKVSIASDDDGLHADQDLKVQNGIINISKSYEGMEANRVYISGGNSIVVASDDGINANDKGAYSAYIEMSGGRIDVEVPSGDTDTLDSNGTIVVTGGYVFLKNGNGGSSQTGGTFDSDRGVTVTGGTVVAVGCVGESFIGATKNTSTTLSSGDYTLVNSNNEIIYSFTLTKSYRAYLLYSDQFTSGANYLKMGNTNVATINK